MPYVDVFLARALARALNSQNTDAIVCGQTRYLGQAILARTIARRRYRVVLYLQMQSGLSKPDWFHNRVYGAPDAAIVLTPSMSNDLQTTTTIDPKKVSVVLIGIDVGLWMQIQTRQAGRLKSGLPSDVAVVGYVARYDSQI